MDAETVLAKKRRRRNMEYAGIIAFQSFFAFRFIQLTDFFLMLIFLVSSFGLAWSLAMTREQRRTLEPNDKKRVITDALESFMLLFIIVLSALFAIQIKLSLVSYESYVCIILLAYFIGSCAGELRWTSKKFPDLDDFRQKNYVMNLPNSLIFPYNIRNIRRSFQSRSRNERK